MASRSRGTEPVGLLIKLPIATRHPYNRPDWIAFPSVVFPPAPDSLPIRYNMPFSLLDHLDTHRYGEGVLGKSPSWLPGTCKTGPSRAERVPALASTAHTINGRE